MGEEIREITCTVCPKGCKAKVTLENEKINKIENLECSAGEDYVRKEIEEPMRDFFTTVRVKRAKIPVLPVRTDRPIPKEKVSECVSELAEIVLDAPVEAGDVVVENLLDLGVDVLATRDLGSVRAEA